MSLFAGIIGSSEAPKSTLFSADNLYRKPAQPTLWDTPNTAAGGSSKGASASTSAPPSEQPQQKRKKRKDPEPSTAAAAVDSLAATEVAAQQLPLGKKAKKARQTVESLPAAKDAEPPTPKQSKKAGKGNSVLTIREEEQPAKKAKKSKKVSTETAEPSKAKPPEKTKRVKGSKKKSLGTLGVEGSAVGEAAAEVPLEADNAAAEALEGGLPQDTDDSPAVKAPKTAEEEAEQLSRTVFVGNLPANIKRKALKALFMGCGRVESVRLRSQPLQLDKKLPRRAAILGKRVSSDRGPTNGYVVFLHQDSVAAALLLNMTEVEGHHIRVDRAGGARKEGSQQGQKTEYDRSCSVFVGNLPFDVKDEEVIAVFNDGGEGGPSVAGVRCVRDAETNIGKGFGYVLFTDRNGAKMALARDGTLLRKRPLRVTRVVKLTPKPRAARPATSTRGTGAEGRLERKGLLLGRKGVEAPASTWQGARTKGTTKVVKPAASLQSKAATPGSGGRSSKRPAVAARKAKQLGKPAPPLQKKGKSKQGKPKGKLGKPRSK